MIASYKVEESLEEASNNYNLKPLNNLLRYLKKPYENQTGISDYQTASKLTGKNYKTYCGT